MVEWWLAWFTTLAAAALGWFWHWHVQKVAHRKGESTIEDVLRKAHHEAAVCVREAQAQAQEILNNSRKEFDLEYKERRQRLEAMEDKHHERVVLMEQKSNTLDARE
ncbi:MAG: Rnase Y domain-containing protein, partial [Kiritimatiellia bacterium]